MRSIKTMLLLAIAATALAVPAAASATQWTEGGNPITEPLQWTDGGAPLAGEPAITLEGPLKFSNATFGGVECTTTAKGFLAGGSIEGVLNDISISLASCKLNGTLKTACSSVTSVNVVSSWWPLEAAEKTPGAKSISVKVDKITYTFQPKEGEAGKYCTTQLDVSGGTVTATPDNAKSISSVSLTGPVAGGKYGNFNTTGTLAVKPAAKFGIARDENVVALAGNIKYSNATIGGVECAVKGSLTLRPGEKGEVTSMSGTGGCVLTGARSIECGTANVVFKEMPWSVSATAAKTINIAKFPFEIQFGKGCSAWNLSGEMVATPNNTSAIASTSLSGTLTHPTLGAQKWGGSLSWSPSGQYGIS